ncbi:MAG: type I restriction endonuclease [Leptolyngbyaceae cyanobacterium]
MGDTIAADQLTLYDLEQRFGLQFAPSPAAFPEWQADLPHLTTAEQARLERVQAVMANLEQRSVLENTVKLAVVAPLLDLAGLMLPPFYVTTETSTDLATTDGNLLVRGRIDVLVLKDQLWVLVIESKRAEFSIKVAIPQALAYMLAAPHPHPPLYGLVTNGTDFVFLKLIAAEPPLYARSKQFVLGQDDDLARVLRVLKHIAEIVADGEGSWDQQPA